MTVSMKEVLLGKIRERTACVGVVGLGYVGLPLAVEFAKAGFRVIGYDLNERVVADLNDGVSHIQDVPDEDVASAVEANKLEATTEEHRLSEMDVVLIAVPTPLSKTRDPDMTFVLASSDAIARNCHPGMLVVLESTTYPGTTRELMQPKLESNGLVVGEDIFLAFSPERVDPGNKVDRKRVV